MQFVGFSPVCVFQAPRRRHTTDGSRCATTRWRHLRRSSSIARPSRFCSRTACRASFSSFSRRPSSSAQPICTTISSCGIAVTRLASRSPPSVRCAEHLVILQLFFSTKLLRASLLFKIIRMRSAGGKYFTGALRARIHRRPIVNAPIIRGLSLDL